jgi:hypothetical protein
MRRTRIKKTLFLVLIGLIASHTSSGGAHCLDLGDTCRISIPDATRWIAAATFEEAYDDFYRAEAEDDRLALSRLLESGDIFAARVGDKVRLVEVCVWSGRAEARWIGGPFDGRKVWLASQFLISSKR